MDTTKTITHLSLCSGYEGIGLGLRRIFPNLREIAYVEREGFVAANLVAKMEEGKLDAAPVHTDVKTFPYRKFRGCVDILSGGFPCQGFSQAGKQKGVNDPRHLFPYIAEGIRECQPKICFLENVQGILSCTTGDGEPVLQYVLRTLEEMGYRATAGIFSAEEVGAPHQRKRVFILGYSQHDGCASLKELRGDEEASDQWTKEESSKTGQSEGASRPIDVPSVQGCTEGSKSEELGYASSLGSHRGIENQNDEQSEVSREGLERVSGEEGEELANANNDGHRENPRGYEEASRISEEHRSEVCGGLPNRTSEELEHSNNEGLEGMRQCNHSQGWKESNGYLGGSSQVWPSRPSQAQYEWEEPRVVANTKRDNEQGCDTRQRQGEPRGSSPGQTEPQLGGATDGSSSRVDATVNRIDRLRLLGNGVVPMTAARAFSTLIQRVI